MKKIKYTPDAADKLRGINSAIAEKYGSKKAKEIIGMSNMKSLRPNECKFL